MSSDPKVAAALTAIADSLARMAPLAPLPATFDTADAFVWHPRGASAGGGTFDPVANVNRIDITLLKGLDRQIDQLRANTRQFAGGLPANNALLWGARGMGKSSLVKAIHAEVNAEAAKGSKIRRIHRPLKLVEIHREDISSLPDALSAMRAAEARFIVFCDDLSFDRDDTSYKSLKAVLEGGIEGRPDNVIFYATSNRRHLMPRDMVENETATGINPSEAVEEKVSLSDRFGLWLGFHNATQDEFLDMVTAYVAHYHLEIAPDVLRREALEWSMTRGARSGRVAWQFILDLAGRSDRQLEQSRKSAKHKA